MIRPKRHTILVQIGERDRLAQRIGQLQFSPKFMSAEKLSSKVT